MKADSPKCHSILAVIRTEFTRWRGARGQGARGEGLAGRGGRCPGVEAGAGWRWAMLVLGKQFAPHFVFGQDYLLYFWWQELFAPTPSLGHPPSPSLAASCPASSGLSVLFDSVFWLGSAWSILLFFHTLSISHTRILSWAIVFRCPCCLMQLNTHTHTHIHI